MKAYLDALRLILRDGEVHKNRTGINTISRFYTPIIIDLSKGFPLLTTKRIYYKAVFSELCWMLHGETNIKFLHERNTHIWDAWAKPNGDLGPIYGKQWRDWAGIDQISKIIYLLKNEPTSRRIILSNWNVGELEEMALPPCHILAQFYVRGRHLDCNVYQRSGDMFLGIPFDIAEYAALIFLICEITGHIPGILNYIIGDAHIYINHIKQVEEQLKREPKELPRLHFTDWDGDINNIDIGNFILSGYNPYPIIKGEVAV